ncbi:hypothetical protein CBR_g5733 [Chara braunii]|uniref:Uncharacterized protein n=1 Tax=Chara braunii TaxID=69332 RepID=A0A388KJ74_CHABU|nr:hypothetical protein CBR_g5733 [Chara braunii]|eukprot:GBG70102.1 hypothetical protein CBR_g5733 [Chara braunii]
MPRWRWERDGNAQVATPCGVLAMWRWERDSNAEMAMPRWRRHVAMGVGWQRRGGDGIGSGIGKRRWPRARDRDRKAEVAMGTTLRTCQTSHVAHFPHDHVAYLPHHLVPRGKYGGGDAEVTTPSRPRDGVLAPSSSRTGKCGGGDVEVATGVASTPHGKCGLTI